MASRNPADRPAETVRLVADLLAKCGHPSIAAVKTTGVNTVQVDRPDRGRNYVQVAHVGPAANPTPKRPSWPDHPTAPQQQGGRR